METPSAHITLETKRAEFDEWVQKHVLSAEIQYLAGNCCSTGRWFECQAAQLGGKASLLACALASHSVQVWMLKTCRRKQGQRADKVPPNKQWLNRYSEGIQLGFIKYYSHFLPVLNLDKIYLTRTANLSMARLTKSEILIFKYKAQKTDCWTLSCQIRALTGSSALILIYLIECLTVKNLHGEEHSISGLKNTISQGWAAIHFSTLRKFLYF